MTISNEGLAGLRILVVEDEMLIAMLLEEMLEMLGCEVVGPAATLDEAVAAVPANRFDGALLDANLHGRDSSPVAEALREHGIPFILVTGYGRSDLEPTALRAAPRVRKPFGFQQLADRMREVFVPSSATS
jgi:DNA-binding response OmpR family regulator